MKKLLLYAVVALMSAFTANSQVNMVENFDAGTPAGWSLSGFGLNSSANTCGTQALRSNLYSFNTTANFTTATATATGGQIDIMFDYKIVNYNSNAATPADFGTLTLEHTIDAGTTWITDTVIDASNHTVANTCATVSTLNTAIEVPAASTVQYRFSAVWNTGDYDLYIDNVSILEVVSCVTPTALAITSSDLSSVTLGWLQVGTPTWEIEYGTPGFTPGTGAGTIMPTTNNPETVTGLTVNSFYDFYVRAICAPGDTSGYAGPVSGNTYNQAQYMESDNACPTAGFVDISTTGTLVPGLGDDTEAGMVLPFSVLYQGVLMNDVTIGSNCGIFLGSQTQNINYGGNFNTLADGYIFPWGDDMHIGSGGAYQEVQGVSPNQVFIIQWDAIRNYSSADTDNATFQIQFHEATTEIFFVYDDVVFGGANTTDDYGANADIGLSGPNQDISVSINDTQYLTDNTCARFYYTDCPKPSGFSATPGTDLAGITWSAGLSGETDWTIIYGAQGFDPTSAGTTITTTTNAASIPGLAQLTTYDVYIYADCDPSLQSAGYMGSFTTLPNCSDITGLIATTGTDSLMTSWLWTESSGVATYPSTGFNVQYGLTGFGLYDGTQTIVNADNDYADTTVDNTLVGGTVYQVYVQAVCATDTSNWVGPIQFLMPIYNDSVCDAMALNVDGTIYTFNNTGATTQVNENTIAPPVTGSGMNDGWSDAAVELTTWFTFTAPASGNMRISGEDAGYIGQVAVYEVTDCADFLTFTLMGANDNGSPSWNQNAQNVVVCGLTSGSTYYLMHDNRNAGNNGTYSIRMEEVVAEAGTTNGMINVCTGDIANIQSGITGFDMGGVWTEEIPTASFSDSTFPSAGLAYQVFNFEYRVTKGCAYDSVMQQVQIYGPSSAGTDGTIDVCQNQPVDLLSGLGGNVDLGGQWYDPSNNTTSSAITSSSIPGSFNYDYITSNGVCPSDTANVVMTVAASCDWADIDELIFGEVNVFPNPTSGLVYISNNSATEVFNYEVTDINGRIIATSNATINGSETAEVNLENLEEGIYMIRLFNDNAEKTYRVVKH